MTKPNELKIENLIKFPVRADEYSSYIWDADENMIAQVRGWGRLQYEEKGAEKQDFILNFIASAINKAAALESENAKLKTIIERLSKAYNCGTSCNADTLKCVKQMDNAKNHPEWYGDGYRNEILKGEKLCLVCAAFTALEGK